MVLALATARPTIVSLDDWLTLRARTHGDRPAVVTGDRTTTYDELDTRARVTARRLAALGVAAGDRVATTLPPSLELVELLHALPRIGAVLVPVNTRLTAAERREQVAAAGARLVLDEPPSGEEGEVRLEDTVDPDALHTVLFTSGTTGRAKPVLLSHRNHAASALASGWALGVAPEDRWLCVLPVFHVGGLAILLRSAVYGTAVVIQERFDPQQATATLAEGGASLVSLVPTMLARLLDAGLRDPPSLRAALVGGAGAPSSLLERAAGAGLPVVRTYGMTETASQVATAREGEPGAAPLPGAEITVAPGGEVLARGPMVAAGSIADDGWLHTGDLGRIDGEGRLHLEGRLAETIVTGGENVVAREVEAALLAHPAVTEATVVGEPDPDWGEAVTAYVVARAESEVSPEELSAHCRERLAGFKVPKAVHRLEALPRNAAGKVERGRLSTLI